MAYVKVADRVPSPEAPVTAPPAADKPSEVESLRGLVATMRKEIDGMKTKPNSGATVRNRTREHVSTLREFALDGVVQGIVTKLYDVKEIKDSTENRRYIGLCSVNVIDPKTGKTSTHKGVNYLEFLNEARKVRANVLTWKKEQRFETDLKKGGGGRGPLKRTSGENEVIVDPDFEFEVQYTDHTFTLKITEGEYEGDVIETDQNAINI